VALESRAKEITTMAPKSAAAVKRAMIQSASVTAKDIMQRPAIAATPVASMRDLAAQLVSNEFSGMPVVAADGKVIGVVTESDIVRVLIDGKRLENLTAGEVMTSPAITVDVDTPLDDVMKIMLVENHIVRVPVTNQGKLVGIISRRDIIRAILEPEFIAFGTFPTRW
jgi:CBS domain-containing protein